MDDVLNWVWQGSAIAIATHAALRFLDRLRASARYALCAMALLTVLALPLTALLAGAQSQRTALDSSAAIDPVVAIPTTWWTSTAVVLMLWSLWCAIASARLSRAFVIVHRAKRECVALPAALEARLPFWNRVSGEGRRARLVVSPSVTYAAVFGGASPTIAVAPALLERLTSDELDRVVIHEWAHVQRRDDVLNLIHLAVRAIAGWHPAVIALERRLRIEREAACDEIAVAVTGSAKRYAACLTTIAGLRPVGHFAMPVVGALSSPALSTRVARILSQRKLISSKWSIRAAVVSVFVMVPVSLIVGGLRLVETTESAADTPIAVAEQPVAAFDAPGRNEQQATVQPEVTALKARSSNNARSTETRAAAIVSDPQPPPAIVQPPVLSHDKPAESAPPLLSGTALHAIRALVPAATPAPAVAPTDHLQPRLPEMPDAGPVAPWTAAADAGVAIGRGSRKGGVATASFFNRLGKKIAGSF